MLQAPLRRKRAPLTLRIQSYLSSQPQPVHYRRIAQRLHIATPTTVLQACVRMAHDGRLRWCGPGMYALGPGRG